MAINLTKVGGLVKVEIDSVVKGYYPLASTQIKLSVDGTSVEAIKIGDVYQTVSAITEISIAGDDCTNLADFETKIATVFLSGGGSSSTTFTELSGTEWDGANAYKTLTANTVLTLESDLNSGVLYIKQDATGNRTLSINSNSVTINTAANSHTLIAFIKADDDYILTRDTNAISGNVPAGYDAHVSAWATAGGVVDDTYLGHVNTFVLALKAASIFTTHFDFLHILCGGTLNRVKFNLINPTDSDAAYRLAFTDHTYAATGATGGAAGYINSFWVPGLAAIAGNGDSHVGVYHRTSAAADNPVWGINQGSSQMYLFPKESGGNGAFKYIEKTNEAFTPANAKGFWLAQGAANITLRKDGVELINSVANGNPEVLSNDYPLVFNAWNSNGTPGLFHEAELSLISAGKAFTGPQQAAYEAAVATLETNLSL